MAIGQQLTASRQWLPEGAVLNNPACNVGWRRVIVCDGVPEARALLAHLTACMGKLRDCVEQQAGGLKG